MQTKEREKAIKQLEKLINEYVYHCKNRNNIIANEEIMNRLLGATYYAYFIGIIEKTKLEKYKNCIKMQKYIDIEEKP